MGWPEGNVRGSHMNFYLNHGVPTLRWARNSATTLTIAHLVVQSARFREIRHALRMSVAYRVIARTVVHKFLNRVH